MTIVNELLHEAATIFEDAEADRNKKMGKPQNQVKVATVKGSDMHGVAPANAATGEHTGEIVSRKNRQGKKAKEDAVFMSGTYRTLPMTKSKSDSPEVSRAKQAAEKFKGNKDTETYNAYYQYGDNAVSDKINKRDKMIDNYLARKKALSAGT